MDKHENSDIDIDALLWQKFLSGDTSSFDQLYSKYVKILFAYGLLFTADRELVKDCIQDVFVKIYEKSTKLNHVYNINVYLRVALKNTITNALEREKIHTGYINALEMPDIDDATPEQELEWKEEQHRIEMILNRLTGQQRKVVQYRFIEDLTLEEISIRMKINYQSVQNTLQRAIKKIKAHFFAEK